MRLPSVLVIEDQHQTRELMGELIANAGYRVDLAASAEEALQVLNGGHVPALILMDLHLPGMDGWRLHQLLAASPLWSRIPVVITSAAGRNTPPPEGVAHHLPKPVRLEALLSVLERYCGGAAEEGAA